MKLFDYTIIFQNIFLDAILYQPRTHKFVAFQVISEYLLEIFARVCFASSLRSCRMEAEILFIVQRRGIIKKDCSGEPGRRQRPNSTNAIDHFLHENGFDLFDFLGVDRFAARAEIQRVFHG